MQLDLFANIEPPPVIQPAPTERPHDAIAELLISGGWCVNSAILTLGGCRPPHNVSYGGHWDLPSRLMQFPVEITNAFYECDGQTRVFLRHPLLADHPWVRALADALGGPLDVAEHGNHASWWHAVDLGGEDRWDDLLETEQFTDRQLIGQAVAHHLHYRRKKFTPAQARKICGRIDLNEPEPSLDGLHRPSICDKRWPLNGRFRPWTLIHGIEQGWLKYRGEFLEWSDAGRAEFERGAA